MNNLKRYVVGDMFELAQSGDIVCITTNGEIKKDGRAVMGAGVAKTARDTFKDIDRKLARSIQAIGNVVSYLGLYIYKGKSLNIISFPTKNKWRDNSDLDLIKQSVNQLQGITRNKSCNIYLPMPGCSNGKLQWHEVEPLLRELDDRYVITTLKDAQNNSEPRILECSSKGDQRFSAFYAKVSSFGKVASIEEHYQLCKRFRTPYETIIPKTVEEAKGKTPSHIELNGVEYDIGYLTLYYKGLWMAYLDQHPELVEYAKQFDSYSDMFKGKSINCQADVIRQYIKEGRESIEREVQPLVDAVIQNIKR